LTINQMNRIIQVTSAKPDGSGSKEWLAQIVHQADNLIVIEAKFPVSINHPQLGYIPAGTTSFEYYWLDRWYNVFRFPYPTGNFVTFYCNVATPPIFDGQNIKYTDLDLDLIVKQDGSWEIIDVAEFRYNALKYHYDQTIRQNAWDALNELVSLVDQGAFPFDQQ
jgi:protein associated with RNAse G/E